MGQITALAMDYCLCNYGSMLQALATQMALDKLGCANETINTSRFNGEIKKAKMLYFAKASLTSGILISKMGRVKNSIRKKVSGSDYGKNSALRDQKFGEFSRDHFRLSPPMTKDDLRERCGSVYSAVLVGSDQLWLPVNIAADYYTLSFVPEGVNTIAYATSFGQAELPRDIAEKAEKFLKKIRHISVRERSGQELIEKLTGRKVPIVCDPTLLLTGDDWMEIQKEEAMIREPYILCYFLGINPAHREFAMRLKKKTGCKIVALLHTDEFVKSDEAYADETPYNVDPADFLNLIRNAAYVCTDSYHCSVFSMVYKKEFFTFRRFARETVFSTNSRLDTLFQSAGLGERILTGNEPIEKCLDMVIDHAAVHKSLEIFRQQSYEYLITALQDSKDTDLQ